MSFGDEALPEPEDLRAGYSATCALCLDPICSGDAVVPDTTEGGAPVTVHLACRRPQTVAKNRQWAELGTGRRETDL